MTTYVLVREGVDELREDLVTDDALGKVFTVIGQSSKRQGGGLLDARDLRNG